MKMRIENSMKMRNANASKYKINNGMDHGLNKTVLKFEKFKLDCPVIKSIPRKISVKKPNPNTEIKNCKKMELRKYIQLFCVKLLNVKRMVFHTGIFWFIKPPMCQKFVRFTLARTKKKRKLLKNSIEKYCNRTYNGESNQKI